MDAPILRVVAQRHDNDCSVACIAMICGVSYENALVAIAVDEPDVCARGVWTKHLQRAAHRLGYKLTSRRRVDLENDTGILHVTASKWPHAHLVVLKSGLIFDTDNCVYDADVFLAANQIKVGRLFIAEPTGGVHV